MKVIEIDNNLFYLLFNRLQLLANKELMRFQPKLRISENNSKVLAIKFLVNFIFSLYRLRSST